MWSRVAGGRAKWREAAVTYWLYAPAWCGNRGIPNTSSPGWKRVTPNPTASTTPETSQPRMNGVASETVEPSSMAPLVRTFQSTGLTPAACTRTSTSVGPGSGRTTSVRRSTSGPPATSWTIAFIEHLYVQTELCAILTPDCPPRRSLSRGPALMGRCDAISACLVLTSRFAVVGCACGGGGGGRWGHSGGHRAGAATSRRRTTAGAARPTADHRLGRCVGDPHGGGRRPHDLAGCAARTTGAVITASAAVEAVQPTLSAIPRDANPRRRSLRW